MNKKIFRAIQDTLFLTLIVLITVRMIRRGINIRDVVLLMMNVFTINIGIVSDRRD